MSVICNKVNEEKKAQATAAAKAYNQLEINALVEEAARGNISAFGDLYSIYLDPIYRYIFYQVNDRMTAEDITEEVFIKAWKAIGSCKGKEKTFSSWLYRIAHNHLINTLRSMQKFTSIEKVDLVDFTTPRQQIETNEDYRQLIKKITCLPRNQRQVIILKFIEGLANQEIVKIMGKSEGAIRALQMRALATLRQKPGEI
jgi:RNA polymerase sigma-70 factor (ECF subfamily)